MYEIELGKQALKDLQKLQLKQKELILSKIKLLAVNPYEQNLDIKKLKGIEGYRMRVGEYRVIYEIINNKLIVRIIKIQSRGNVYG